MFMSVDTLCLLWSLSSLHRSLPRSQESLLHLSLTELLGSLGKSPLCREKVGWRSQVALPAPQPCVLERVRGRMWQEVPGVAVFVVLT